MQERREIVEVSTLNYTHKNPESSVPAREVVVVVTLAR